MQFDPFVEPFGQADWEHIDLEFNRERAKNLPNPVARDSESLKNKFEALRNVRKPAGDHPTCPVEVKRAKRIQRLVENKISVANFGNVEQSDFGVNYTRKVLLNKGVSSGLYN